MPHLSDSQGTEVERLAEKLADVRKTSKRRKAQLRTDAVQAPVDGDYDPLTLVNKDPAFEYFWASARDRARLGHRGWIEEQWGPASARPAYYYGDQVRGSAIRIQELTLMKLPADLAERQRQRDPARLRHAQRMREVLRPDLPNHRTTLTEQTLTGPTRS